MSNPRFVVITSIHEPTEAVRAFAQWDGWTTVVVGDLKSPRGWAAEHVLYLSLQEQEKRFPELAALVPKNTYLRKMFGYLHAFTNGATAIFETDDDNIPYPGAAEIVGQDLAADRGAGLALGSATGWLNIYARFGAPDAWPRGFPLQYVSDVTEPTQSLGGAPWAVRQYLADEEPDLDAVFRMTRNRQIFFPKQREFRLQPRTFCPFNSQATLWTEEAFPLMFLPLGKTDRVTDILRGYMSLAALWAGGRTVSYASPVVYQKRNPHALLSDFQAESELYQYADLWSKTLRGVGGASCSAAFAAVIELLIDEGTLRDVNRHAFSLFRRYT